MRCRACRSAYLDPRPSTETIELAYRSYYTHGSAPPPPSPAGYAKVSPNDYAGPAGLRTTADRPPRSA